MANYDAVPSSGITARTPKKVMLGAGTIHKGLTYTEGSGWNFTESLWFATGDGVSLTFEKTFVESADIADGAWVKVKGLMLLQGEKATIKATPVEITPDLIKAGIMAVQAESDVVGYDMLTSNEFITDDMYIENFAWVGKTQDNAPMIVIFPLALCTSGLELENASDEKTCPEVEFECVNDFDDNMTHLHYRIYTPSEAAAEALVNGEDDE